MDSNKDKYICTFLLHALGDTIGFKNADWEFNYNKESSLGTVMEFIFEFIDLGGVNGIDLKDWIVSDDTLYHMSIAKSILKYEGKIDEKFMLIVKNNLIKTHNKMIDEEKRGENYRFPGKTTNKYIQKFTETEDGRHFPYDKMSGGNGSAMRNLCIGLAFHKENQLDDLINVSIQTSRMTHNSPIGYLAGLTSAFFISLAIRDVNILKWPFQLIDLLESDKIKTIVNAGSKTKNTDEFNDYVEYIRYWKKYIDTRFVDYKPIKTRSTSNMIFRIKYYYENFVKDTNADFIGGSGFCAMIMAYDAILDCDGRWEKLVFYAMLHPGDSDTVGAIAGGIYGALFGFGDVPEKMLCCVEKKDSIIEMGNSFYEKFKN
jgi:ADP-ribosylglycohydrolase